MPWEATKKLLIELASALIHLLEAFKDFWVTPA